MKDLFFNNNKDDNLPCEIQEGLFLGSIGAAYNKGELLRHKVTHILSVENMVEPLYPLEFKYKRVEVRDSAYVDLRQYFEECFEFIDEAKKNGGAVLVHCFLGRSRSVTIVIAYLMKTYGMNFKEAFDVVRKKRPQASPNPGFCSQLSRFEKQLLETHDTLHREESFEKDQIVKTC
ncbi:hypothetical protein KP509_06G057800 [Ceratopteris richardii]|nr:hypothetical protein KP509_06G057800 [Ceratopteris richardii]